MDEKLGGTVGGGEGGKGFVVCGDPSGEGRPKSWPKRWAPKASSSAVVIRMKVGGFFWKALMTFGSPNHFRVMGLRTM